MKTKEEQKKRQQMTKKQKKVFAIVSSCIAIAAMIVFGLGNINKNDKEKVLAAPLPVTGSVTVDNAHAQSYNVPADATTKYETVIASDYLQSQGYLPNLTKHIINTYTSNIEDGATFITSDSSGNLYYMVNSRSEALTDFNNPYFLFRKSIIKTDSQGQFLDQKFVATGLSSYTSATNTTASNESSRDGGNPVIDSSGKMGGQYLGTTPTSLAADTNKTYSFNYNTMSGFSWNDLVYTGLGTAQQYVYNQIDSILHLNDGKTYFNGGGKVFGSAVAAVDSTYELYSYDVDNGTFDSANISFTLESYNSATGYTVSGTEQVTDGFTDLYYHGGFYYCLVRYGPYMTNGPLVANYIYKVNSSGTTVSKILVSDISQNVTNANTLRGLNEADNSHYYYMDYSSGSAKLQQLNLNTMVPTTLAVFPNGTIVNNITPNSLGNYDIYMTVNASAISDPMFSPYLSSAGVVIGTLKSDYSIENLSVIATSGSVALNSVNTFSSSNYVSIAGYASMGSDLIVGPYNKLPGATNAAFYGTLKKVDDYAPAIKFTDDNIAVDITKSATAIESQLLSDIVVTDTYDLSSDNLSGQKTQAWLDNRINRNPLRINYDTDGTTVLSQADIDWLALGFDKTNAGPQTVKYFITDGSLQSSAASRWINKTTPETVIDGDYALDAQNFAIPLTDISSDITDEEDFKELAKTMAWDMDSHTIDEDSVNGTFDPAKVTVDATQLATLQAATEAKPYPVDVTYKPNASTTIVNRVWVFVTTKNTVVDIVDGQNGVVIYADDYTLPLHLAQTETKANVYDHANVKVYNYYDNSNETAAVLPTIADKSNATDLDVLNLGVITGTTGATVVQPQIEYTWAGGTTVATPHVTITAQVLMHVRQVVYSSITGDLDELVVPSEGYLQLVNTSTRQLNLVVDSGEESTNPAFKEVYTELDDTGGNDKLDFEVIVPEYYEYKGYVVTNTAGGHSSTLLTTGTYTYDLTNGNYEQWITVYVTPKLGTDGSPKPYAWDYKLNDFGTIDAD